MRLTRRQTTQRKNNDNNVKRPNIDRQRDKGCFKAEPIVHLCRQEEEGDGHDDYTTAPSI